LQEDGGSPDAETAAGHRHLFAYPQALSVASPFKVLGLEPGADEDEIVRAYRRRVKETHPDHGGSAAEFQAVLAAYAELSSGDSVSLPAGPEEAPDAAERDRDGADGTDDETGGEADGEDDDSDGTSRVEYLDYQVLVDHGWSLDDEDLFEKAAAADLDPADYGRIVVEPSESLLEAAENRGFAWPYACRGGACSNCAVAVVDGEMPDQRGHILPREMLDRGFRLSCLDGPVSDDLRVVFNVKHLPDLDELRLPTGRFQRARPTD
jgi:curved DNA-binding protein CbpA